MPVAATTFYDVVTRYRVETGQADRGLRTYERRTLGADRATARLYASTRGLRMTFGHIARLAGPVGGGLLTVAAGGMALAKTFRNLNEEANSTIQMAMQMNLAFQFEGATTAAQNFEGAMALSRQTIQGLIQDAARLPGELKDFIDISKSISGAVFAGGGNARLVRDLTARIALAAPNDPSAGRQAMRILFGTASVADSTMFAMMQGSGLLRDKRGSKLDTAGFNALQAAERLRVFDEGLKKLTDNPAFRKQILRTFDTQLGTFTDHIFGVEGVLGRLSRGPFNSLLDWLTDLNTWFDENGPNLARRISAITGLSAQKTFLGLTHDDEQKLLGLKPARHGSTWGTTLESLRTDNAFSNLVRQMTDREVMRITQIFRSAGQDDPFQRWPVLYSQIRAQKERFVLDYLATPKREGKAVPREFTDSKVEQTINIKVDVRSDQAPDAIAVALKRAAAHPKTAKRAISLAPRP